MGYETAKDLDSVPWSWEDENKAAMMRAKASPHVKLIPEITKGLGDMLSRGDRLMSGFAGLWQHRPRTHWVRVLCQDRAGVKTDP